jgi:hypothetical protein
MPSLDQRGGGDSEWWPTLECGPEAHARIAAWIEHLGVNKAPVSTLSVPKLDLTPSCTHSGSC